MTKRTGYDSAGGCPVNVPFVRWEWLRRLFPDWKLLAERREEAADTALR